MSYKISKRQKNDILPPKIRNLEATVKSLRFEKKKLHREIGDLTKIRKTNREFSRKK